MSSIERKSSGPGFGAGMALGGVIGAVIATFVMGSYIVPINPGAIVDAQAFQAEELAMCTNRVTELEIDNHKLLIMSASYRDKSVLLEGLVDAQHDMISTLNLYYGVEYAPAE